MQHLLHKTQFDAVLGTRPVARTEHFFAHRLADQPMAVGVMVPKRHAKRAVTRNLIKRQIYTLMSEAEKADQLAIGAYLVRLRIVFDKSHFVSAASDALKAAVRAELQALIASIVKK